MLGLASLDGLSAQHISNINVEALDSFSVEHISSLSQDAISGFTPEQIVSLSDPSSVIAVFREGPPENMQNFDPQIFELHPAATAGF